MKGVLELDEDVGFIRIPGVLEAAFGFIASGLDSGERTMPIAGAGAGGCASCGDTAAMEALKRTAFSNSLLNQF